MTRPYHVDGTQPAEDEIFVFGSNEAGRHGAGAAAAAYKLYGAEYGNGLGLSGRSYAIPTKDFFLETLPLYIIEHCVNTFLEFAEGAQDKKFFMTRIGCGLAGYSDYQIAPFFRGAPTNINFPEEWKYYLEMVGPDEDDEE